MRLDKLLANRNYGSRKDVKKLIKSKLVKINDTIVTTPNFHVNEGDNINIDGLEWEFIEEEYLIFHKPKGCVSANYDNVHPTVFDYLPADFTKTFHIVGRLDYDTEGLIIITNDGKFIHKVISPSNKVGKTYEVHLRDNCQDDYIEKFKEGVIIEDYKCMSADLKITSENTCELTIYEGKFHQVKKMFLALSNEVTYLKRLSIGNLHLGTLPIGEYRMIDREQMYDLCISNEN